MVDWPVFMRRKMVCALAESVRKYDSIVVAVNRPLCPFTTWIRKPDRINELFGPSKIEKLSDNLFLFSPKYFVTDMITRHFEFLNYMNLIILRSEFGRLEGKLKVQIKQPIVWIYHPVQGYLTSLYPNSLNLMEVKDNYVDLYGRSDNNVDELERRFRPYIDLLLATSQKSLKKYGPNYKTAWLSGNGLDRNTYQRLTAEDIEPYAPIKKISAPRIGYTGIISDRLDWKLVKSVIEKSADKNFIFVGQVADRDAVESVRSLPNAHFIGKVPHEQIPAVLKAFDLGWMPYRDNRFFRYSNPLKFYEFAAAGIPMVSSNMEHLNQFDQDFVEVIENREDLWIDAIEKMLAYDRGEALETGRAIASGFIWEDMTEKLVEQIRNHFYI
jgi:hypothetical protein